MCEDLMAIMARGFVPNAWYALLSSLDVLYCGDGCTFNVQRGLLLIFLPLNFVPSHSSIIRFFLFLVKLTHVHFSSFSLSHFLSSSPALSFSRSCLLSIFHSVSFLLSLLSLTRTHASFYRFRRIIILAIFTRFFLTFSL